MTDLLEKKARRLWTGLICGMLGLHVFCCGIAVYLATSSHAIATIPGYYEKSLNWDQQKARQLESRQLGWTGELEVSPATAPLITRTLSLRLIDKHHQPLTADAVSAIVYQINQPDQIQELNFEAITVGFYQARFQTELTGLWTFELTATKGQSRWIDLQQIDLTGR